MGGDRTTRRWLVGSVTAAMVVSLLVAPTDPAAAQSDAPTGVTVEQGWGFATVAWDPVEGATQYQIERTLMDGDEPAAEPQIVGIWEPDRYIEDGGFPGYTTFADSAFVLGERYRWRVRALSGTPSGLLNQVTVDAPSSAAGTYGATGAAFGPSLGEAGVSGDLVVVNAGGSNPTQGCGTLIDFPDGAIAIADRGGCPFVEIVGNAEAAGASAVIVVNNTGGTPIELGGSSTSITIPSGMVSLADGDAIKAGLPATGTFSPPPVGPWSDPVVGDTLEPVGPEEFLTEFERSGGIDWTSHPGEVAWIEELAAASDRVRLETIGTTYEGRPMHLAVVGDPAPASVEEIADSPTVLLTCTVHGSERSGREACMMLLRQLAFSDEAWVTDILSQATVLINPTANPDGQSVGRRTNTAGQDLNRDHLLLRHPEAVALAETIRDYQPDLIVDAHEKGGGPDNDPMWSRSRIINETLVRLGQDDMVLGAYFNAGYEAGWSMLPYTVLANNNWEAWLHNTAGMKNVVGMLLETPIQTTASRPGEGPPGSNRPLGRARRVYTQLWSLHVLLDYHHDNLDAIQDAIETSTEANANNEGPIYLDGAYEPPFNPPPSEPWTVMFDPAPCGYRLDAQQLQVTDSGTLIGPLAGQPWESQTVEERLAVHGIDVEDVGVGIKQVRLAQPLRPVIPYVLDPDLNTAIRPIGTPNIGMVDATRLDDRRATVAVGSVATGVPNRVDDGGCSINDLIADEQTWPNRALFRSHVNQVVNDLRAAGLVDQREASEIRIAATRSEQGR